MSFKSVVVLMSIFLYAIAVLAQLESDFEVELDSFDILTEYDTKYVDWDTLRMKRQGRNLFVLGGNAKLNLNLQNELIVVQVFNYDKEKDSKGLMIFNMEKPICKFISEDEDIYPGMKEKSNLPDKDTCPFPKNEYSIDNYEVNVDFLPKSTPAGEYLVLFLIKDGPTNPVAGFKAAITIKK